MAVHPLVFADGMQLRVKAHDGAAGHRAQVVRPQHVQQRVGDFREFVLNFFTELAGQKGEAFQQPFNIRIGALLRKKPCQLWIGIREFPALKPEKT